MMTEPLPICDLAEALRAQEVEAIVFLPFAIRCLQAGDSQATEARLSVQILRPGGNEITESLLVRWSLGSIPSLPPAVQENIVVEWGALGVACTILYSFGGGLRLTDSGVVGDGFDYWVGNETQVMGAGS